MKTVLAAAVLYVPLVDHLRRVFIGAPTPPPIREGATPPPAAALASLQGDFDPGLTTGSRPALVVEELGGKQHAVNLVVFRRPGDPGRDAVPATSEFVLNVPYDPEGAVGTYHFETDAVKIASAGADPFDGMTVSALNAYAEENKVDLGTATKKADIIAALRAAATREPVMASTA